MFTVYVLANYENRLYIGLTNSLQRRLKEHSKGYYRSTRAYRPYKLILHEQFENRQEARNREKYLKSGTGREWIKHLMRRGVEK